VPLTDFVKQVLSSVAFKLAYNIHFHPLSKFPGPTLFAASRLLYIWHLLRGTLVDTTVDLHKRYGKVVRIAPDELSFSSGDAWKQIYGNQQGRPQRPKDKRFYTDSSTGTPNIILGSDKEHSRFRRILSHAFSETALRAQESLMQKYVNLMIQRLHENAARGAPLDMVEWYNFTTFDMIGDLTFGQPFGCLENSKYHSWVAMIFGNIKLAPYLNATKRVPGLQNLLSHFLPKELVAQRQEHHRLTNDIVQKRLSQGNGRPDFMSEILKHNDPKTGMNAAELVEHAEILIIAGSETTATLLCGVTYYLLRNPHVLQKLAKEIRDAFITEEEINITAINGLEYTLAVLNEGLRMYPPVPSGLPRLIKTNGGIIGGSWVPAGVSVSLSG
jgi:cytochrome P450